MRIRIQGANQLRIRADPDPDPAQTCRHKKLDFDMKNILYVGKSCKSHFERLEIEFYLLIFVNFLAPGSGSPGSGWEPNQCESGSETFYKNECMLRGRCRAWATTASPAVWTELCAAGTSRPPPSTLTTPSMPALCSPSSKVGQIFLCSRERISCSAPAFCDEQFTLLFRP